MKADMCPHSQHNWLASLKISLVRLSWLLVFAAATISFCSVGATQGVTATEPRLEVGEGADGVFHIRVLAPLTIGEEQFEVVGLERSDSAAITLSVGVFIEQTSEQLIEGWVHVVGVDELRNYKIRVFYTVPCSDPRSSSDCRREYVLAPIDNLKSN